MVQTSEHIVIVGAGAAGLMAARELARAGRKVTVLEARERCGGRILPLSGAEFGYPAAGGAEFVHGEAPVTRGLLREAGLSLHEMEGEQWRFDGTRIVRGDDEDPLEAELHAALRDLKDDLPIAEFLRRHFAGERFAAMRHAITGMVEGYDAADPERASTLALREEWMDGGHAPQARVDAGYGALIEFLVSECRKTGVTIRLGCVVTAVEQEARGVRVRVAGGDTLDCDRIILTVPLPLLRNIALPDDVRARLSVIDDIGFGNVIKILLRFPQPWWRARNQDLARMTFLISDETIPVWWTQYPNENAVLTGWFGGPRTAALQGLDPKGLIDAGVTSLAAIFGVPHDDVAGQLIAAVAIDWSKDPFAGGAYSWATPRTRAAQDVLASVDGAVSFSGEALYGGRDMGTVEAALASGLETARAILRA